MTRFAQTARRVAMALSVLFGALAVLVASGYLRQHGGWDLESGSNDLMTIMLLVLGFVLALSVAVLRPGTRNTNGTRLTSVIWTVALLVALLFTWRVIVSAHRWEGHVGTIVTSPQEFDAFVTAHPDSFAAYDYRVPTGIFLQSFEFLNTKQRRNGRLRLADVWSGDPGPRHAGHRPAGGGRRRHTKPKRSGGSSGTTARNRSAGTSAARFGRTSTMASTPLTGRISGSASGLRSRSRASSRCPISAPTAT